MFVNMMKQQKLNLWTHAPLKTELADLVGGEQVIADAEAWLEQDRANR